MKSIHDENSHLLGATTMAFGPGRHKAFDDLKERMTTDILLSAGFVAIIALYAVMFVGLYYWSQRASVFPPDKVFRQAIVEAPPWAD